MQAVEAQNVNYRITTGFFTRPRALLRDVTLCIPQGGTWAIIGANGAGKTTLFKTLLGALRPHTGTVHLFGRPAELPAARTRVGYMPEKSPFAPSLKAREIVQQYARLTGLGVFEARAAAAHQLARVGLTDAAHLPVRALSKGMLQRLSLAQALVGQPRLLLLDEPMSGLDPQGRMLVRDLLLEQRSHGTTILFSSHAMADVQAVADTVIVMDQGRVIQQGPPHALPNGTAPRAPGRTCDIAHA